MLKIDMRASSGPPLFVQNFICYCLCGIVCHGGNKRISCPQQASTSKFTQIFKVVRSPFLFSDVSWIHRVPACIEQYAHCVLREPGKHLNLKKWKWKARGADTAVCQRQRQTQRQETKTQRQEHRQTKQHRKWKLAFLKKGLTCPQGVTRLAVENSPI